MNINQADLVTPNEHGITIKSGETKVFLSWNVIDQLAEASEVHYQSQVIEDMRIMHSQKVVN